MKLDQIVQHFQGVETLGDLWFRNGAAVSEREIEKDLYRLLRGQTTVHLVMDALRPLLPVYNPLPALYEALPDSFTVREALHNEAVQAALKPFGFTSLTTLLPTLGLVPIRRDGTTVWRKK